MAHSFLLRFQEPCLSDKQGDALKTETRIQGEKGDLSLADCHTLLLVASHGKTITKIEGEKENDRGISDAPWGGKTKTYIRRETDGNDPKQQSRLAIPQCS